MSTALKLEPRPELRVSLTEEQTRVCVFTVSERSSENQKYFRRMRKKTRKTKPTTKSNQKESELVVQSSGSIAFVDENSVEVQVKGQINKKDKRDEEEGIKDDTDRVIAVIDKNPAEESKVEDEEGDDVPEDVSWKASKESAIRERTREKEILLDTKRKEKQLRIERNERLREQKERKRAREYSRLPVEVLQQVAKQQESQPDEEVTQVIGTGDHVTFDSSSEDEQEEESEQTPAIKVLVLPRETKKHKTIQQSASLFLQERLFGDRIQRISAMKESDNKRKQRSGFGPAVKFSKKSL